MKKRIASLLLAFLMAFSLAPAALAAEAALAPAAEPPYSLQYLQGIQGVEYLDCLMDEDTTNDDGDVITQLTTEGYGVLDLWNSVNGDWEKVIAPFRKAFTDAGFEEWTDEDPDYAGETWYYYDSAAGERFVILGRSESQEYMESGVGLVIYHARSNYFGTLDNFRKAQTYTSGQFTDVPDGKWYAKAVQNAYELGLMKGGSDGAFATDNPITIAETLVLACRMNDIYYSGKGEFTQGKPWYQVYVDYAIENAIIGEGEYTDYTAPATREQFAWIMYCALPDRAFAQINDVAVADIPDSASFSTDYYLGGALTLYQAGILTGSGDGSFNPQDQIKRSEVAAIVSRMVMESERVALS